MHCAMFKKIPKPGLPCDKYKVCLCMCVVAQMKLNVLDKAAQEDACRKTGNLNKFETDEVWRHKQRHKDTRMENK